MRFFNRFFFIIILFFSLGVIGSNSQASTTTESFRPTDDAYVDASNANINYKNADLEVGYYNLTYLLREEISYLGFNVSLPSDANITEIKLGISVRIPPSDEHTIHLIIHETNNFSEDTLTYANRPSLGNIVAEGNIAPESELFSVTVFYFVLTTHTFNISTTGYFLGIKTDTDHSSGIRFYSNSSERHSPKLIITYSSSQITTKTSLSVGFSLIGILLLGMIFRKKRI